MTSMFKSVCQWLRLQLGLPEPPPSSPASLPQVDFLREKGRRWWDKDEKKIDKEHDIVIVPSDGGCLSGTDSEGSDWSEGWTEQLSKEFADKPESGFAVLIPCYKQRRNRNPGKSLRNKPVDFLSAYSSEDNKYVERWLSSIPLRYCAS